MAAGELSGHANSVLDGVGVGGAMADDGNALDAQQRSAAVLGVVEALLEVFEGAAGEQEPDLAGDGGTQRFLQQVAHGFDQTLGNLECDVADETVADDNVDVTVIEVAPLDVADEIQG